MRRRIVLDVFVAVILLAILVVVLRFAMLAGEFNASVAAESFEAARNNHTALRAFLNRMPKGGDLHTHLFGAVYAERFIAWAAAQGLCVDPANAVLEKPRCPAAPDAVPVSDAMQDQGLYDRLIDAFSMRRIPAKSRGADGPRPILRDVRQVQRGVQRASRRHDSRPAPAIQPRERAICRVHGVVFLPERA